MNLAFAGFRHGHIMGLYQEALVSDEVTLIGCVEENEEARELAKKNYGVEFTYDTYEELLQDERVEAVAIGDYYQKRGSMAIAALKAGKHVMCDKPLCTDLDELALIEALSNEKGLQVCCMYELRYMPNVAKVKELIDNGEIGNIRTVSFTGQHCLSYGSRPGWYFEQGKHGGTINDIAIHGVDILRVLTGKNLTAVNYAKTWNAYADKEPDFKDCGQFVAEMEDMTVMADVSYAAPGCNEILPTYWNFNLWGTEGMIQFNYLEKNQVHLYKKTHQVFTCEDRKVDYLHHFVQETQGIATMMDKENVIASQRQVLEIQKAADLRG